METRSGNNTSNYIGSLLKHSVGFLSGDFISKALYIILLPVITILISPGDFGILSIYLTLLNVISVVFRIGIPGAITRIYYDQRDRYSLFLGSNTLFLLGYSLLLCLLVQFVFRSYLAEQFNIPKNVISFALFNAVFYMIINIYTSHLQATRQSKKYSRIEIFYKVSSVLISIVFMYYMTSEKYLSKVYADAIILVLSMIIVFKNFIKVPTWRISKEELAYGLKFGLPLLPHTLSALILHMFDRIIINQIVGEAATGLYSLAYQIGVVLQIVILGMNRSWITFFYEKLETGNIISIQQTFRSYQKVIITIACGIILFSGDAVLLLVDERYHSSIGIISPIVAGYVFLFFYTIYGNYLFFAKKTTLISINSMIATIINIVSNYYFIGRFGYIAAAYTTLGSFMVLFGLNYIVARWKFKHQTLPLKNILPAIIALGLTILLMSNIGVIENLLLRIVIKVLYFGFLAMLLFFNIIKSKLQKV